MPPKSNQFPNDDSILWDAFKKNDLQSNNLNKENTSNENNIADNNLDSNHTNKHLDAEKDYSKIRKSNPENEKKFKSDNNKKNVTENNFDDNRTSKNIESEKEQAEIKKSNLENDKKLQLDRNEENLKSDLSIKKEDNIKVKDKKEENISKNFYIQLASLSKQELVILEWQRLQKKYSKELKGLTFVTEIAKIKEDKVFYRLMVGKFSNKEKAKNLCAKMKMDTLCIIKEI